MLRLDVETLNEENRRLKGKLNEYSQKHEVKSQNNLKAPLVKYGLPYMIMSQVTFC